MDSVMKSNLLNYGAQISNTNIRYVIGYEPFCEAIRNLFGSDVSTQDLKALFRKIALNPDAKVDWSEVNMTLDCKVNL